MDFNLKWKEAYPKLEWLMIEVGLLVGIFGLCFGLFIYMVTVHNIDLAYNIFLIMNDVNSYFYQHNISQYINIRKLNDTTASFDVMNYLEGYIHSGNHQILAIILMVVSSYEIGYCLTCMKRIREWK